MKMIYVTGASQEEMCGVVRVLLQEKLIACANIFGGMLAMYNWQDELQEEEEVAAFLKVMDDDVGLVMNRVKQLHSYECPCIVVLNVDMVDVDFASWISEVTRRN